MHSIWSGNLSFGLINISVKLYPASLQRELKFKLIHKKDLSEIGYSHICKAENKEVPWDEIAKSYEYSKGDFVILTEEDFEKADLKKSKTIEIKNFTYEDEIDSIYFETPYYLEPAKGAEKAYILLREALKTSRKAAIGNFAFRHHEHLCLIKPHENVLLLNQLRYKTEIINPKNLNISHKKLFLKKEMEIAVKLINELTMKFNPKDYSDTYNDEIKKIIKKKASGKPLMIKEKIKKPTKVYDIMSELKKSLSDQKKHKKRKAG